MTRTQIQFPDPLYRRLKEIAEYNDWSLADVVRRATELYATRFPPGKVSDANWDFPVVDMGGDFLRDPAEVRIEAEVTVRRSK